MRKLSYCLVVKGRINYISKRIFTYLMKHSPVVSSDIKVTIKTPTMEKGRLISSDCSYLNKYMILRYLLRLRSQILHTIF